MNEILHIKNFGPIKDVKLELKKFNVLIGENATGKSTIAKLLAVCRYFSYLANYDDIAAPATPFEDGLVEWGLSENKKEGSYIEYHCEHYSFIAECLKRKDIKLVPIGTNEDAVDYVGFFTKLTPKSNQFISLLSELKKLKPKKKSEIDLADIFWRIPISFFKNDVAAVLDNPFYLPTERGLQSIFSLGKNSIPNISDSLYNQFAKIDLISRNFKSDVTIEPLDLTYRNNNGKPVVKKNGENEFYSLNNGASGYQSAIPIVLVAKYYSEIRKKPKTFIIEEPELNLFPTAQQKLVHYLSERTIQFDNTTLLTTHSPYILTSINNLMYAYEVGKTKEENVDKIVPKKNWLNPSNVSAYILKYDGTCEDILDSNENLIRADKIDEVSTVINKEFDNLINIEIGISDEIY